MESRSTFPGLPSSLHRIMLLLVDSFQELGAGVSIEEIEKLAIFIQEVMSNRNRFFHTYEHLFELSKGLSGREVLAVLFHDIMYFQVDGGAHPRLREWTRCFQPSVSHSLLFKKEDLKAYDQERRGRGLAHRVFGVHAGDRLTAFSGMNEFLSAVTAENALSPFLTEREILCILACIELTIPFRGADAKGQWPTDLLASRLLEISEELGLNLDAQTVESMIQSGIRTSFADIGGFSAEDVGIFLDNTWQLVSEGNPALRSESYRVGDYRAALEKQEKFLGSLDAERVFYPQSRGDSGEQRAALVARAKENLRIGSIYLQAKLLAIAVVEAFAKESGGDAPLMLFMGKASQPHTSQRFEQLLEKAEISEVDETETDGRVKRLLKFGRTSPSYFDLKDSPLAYYFYSQMTRLEFSRAVEASRAFYAGKVPAGAFLEESIPGFRPTIATIMSEVAWSRRERMTEIARRPSARPRRRMG